MAEEMPLTSSPGEENLEDCIALCLSGGGYRAMLFHLGTLWYLNDAEYLPKLARISSVSGGSITAATLAIHWGELKKKEDFESKVVEPVRNMAGKTIDVQSILGGVFGRGSVSDRIIGHYEETLYGQRTLQDLPDQPRFVINATNVQTGSLFRFSKPYIGDYRIGLYKNPTKKVSEAVAASSAFPPILSPMRLEFGPHDFDTDPGPLNKPPFNTEVYLSDGGVYDNLGIETSWKRCKTILVSDAGGKMVAEAKPHTDWAFHGVRIASLVDNQVRSLRKRQIVAAFKNGDRKGAYWGMWTDPAAYSAQSALALPGDKAAELAGISTRLAELSAEDQERLIDFGYGMAERAIRSYYDPQAFAAPGFPYARGI
ncbi:MAG TPA: patatin-like phospholipase family protein [Thermoanaerobaculia bacterium]|nr:patatin-like phospholipase family protein [Thermoanaerobaculia bacterium]